MKTKNIIILGVVFIIIVGIIFLSEQLGSKKTGSKSNFFFPGFTSTNCSAFRISDSNGSIKIQKKGDLWVVGSTEKTDEKKEETPEGSSILDKNDTLAKAKVTAAEALKEYPADSASVTALLEKISGMKKDALISQNRDKQALFEVDTAKGLKVEVWDSKNKSLGCFLIGKNGPDWSSHYVRMMGSDDVYNVFGSIKYSFFTDKNRWRDKTVMKFDKSLAKKIAIAKKDSGTIVLERTVDTTGISRWNITQPVQAPADSGIVTRIVSDLAQLTTSNWEESSEISDSAMGFTAPDLAVAVDLDNGDQKTIMVGRKKGETSEKWVRTTDRDAVFLMYESRFSDLSKPLADFKVKDTTSVQEIKKVEPKVKTKKK